MNLNLLWFLPAIIVYSWLWYIAYKDIEYYEGLLDSGFGILWVLLNIIFIALTCSFIGISKFAI